MQEVWGFVPRRASMHSTIFAATLGGGAKGGEGGTFEGERGGGWGVGGKVALHYVKAYA